eukprot:scaffold58481_cov31-Tisochrysis_lutea.AAC.3
MGGWIGATGEEWSECDSLAHRPLSRTLCSLPFWPRPLPIAQPLAFDSGHLLLPSRPRPESHAHRPPEHS